MGRAKFAVLILVLSLGWGTAYGQQCAAPSLSALKGFNIFTEEQEVILGEVFAESASVEYRVIEDPALTAYMQEIGNRVARHFPPNQLKFRFYIIDAPYANAFAFPGGRVYVTRKLISVVKSEDELAGVLAHEMGHQVAHHGAFDWSKRFRDISSVSKVTSRADIEDAYNKFLDTYRKNIGLLKAENREDKEQLQADEVAVYAVAQAGYRPAAVSEFWDRFTETKGKKGSWFSDMFGTTLPEMKRLREFVKNVSVLPEGCVEKSTAPSPEQFLAWQKAVKTYSGFGKKLAVSNIAATRELQPQLRGDIDFLRFSQDGKYLLAQDEASIFVLSTNPLQALFRIDAEDAYPPQFTPDSQGVVFYTTGLRVERWSIPDKSMQQVDDIHVFRSCRQTELSPDGKWLACLEPDRQTFFPMELVIIDVAKGEPAFSKKDFLGPVAMGWTTYFNILKAMQWEGNLINMHFSPDGRYFTAGTSTANIGVDLNTMAQMSLPGAVKKAMTTNFTFLGPDRILGVEGDNGGKSVVLKFPQGDALMADIEIGNRGVTSPAHGDYVIVRPLLKAPVGIYDLQQKKLTIGSKTDAIDIHDGMFAGERKNGEIALYRDPASGPIATLTLPPAPLARLKSTAISPDGSLLAVSDRKRGAVWNLNTGERLLFLRGFRGVDFDSGTIHIDFPPADDYDSPGARKQKLKDIQKENREKPGHSIAHFDLKTGNVTEGENYQQKHRVMSAGKWLLVLNSGKDDEDDFSKNVTLQVKNARTGEQAWTKKFSKNMPGIYYDPRSELILFSWELGTGGAKDAMNGDAEAKRKVDAILEPEDSQLFEIVDLRTGNVMSRFPVDTGKGSFTLVDAFVRADRIYFTDTSNRILVYSNKGDLLGRYFGKLESVSPDNRLLMLETERGRLAVFDTNKRTKLQEMTFESPIGFAEFSSDAKKMYVLTRDQKLYTVNLPEMTAKSN